MDPETQENQAVEEVQQPAEQPAEQPTSDAPVQPEAAEAPDAPAPVVEVKVNLTDAQKEEGAYYPGVPASLSTLDGVLHQMEHNDAFQLGMITVTQDGQPVEGDALVTMLAEYAKAAQDASDALAALEATASANTDATAGSVNGQENPADVLKAKKRGK